MASAELPVMLDVIPVSVLIVSVLNELACTFEMIIGKVSPVPYVASVREKVTGPFKHELL